VRRAKTAEPIDMPFWMNTQVGPQNRVLDGDADPQGKGAIFGDCPGYSKALAIFAATVVTASLSRSLQTGSFYRQQPPHAADGITQYVRQAQIVFEKFLGAGDAAYRPRRRW